MSADQTLGAMLCDKTVKKQNIKSKNKPAVIRFCNSIQQVGEFL